MENQNWIDNYDNQTKHNGSIGFSVFIVHGHFGHFDWPLAIASSLDF